MNENLILNKIYFFIWLLIPIALITGPAIPDILLVLFCLLFVYQFIFKPKKMNQLDEKWMIILGILWIWFIFISFFAHDFMTSFSDALIFIRFIIFIISSYVILKSIKNAEFEKFLLLIFVICSLVALDTLFQFYNYSFDIGFGKDIFGRVPEGLYGRLSGPFQDLVPGCYLSRLFFICILYVYIKIDQISNRYKLLLTFCLSLFISVIFFSGERMAFATLSLGIILCILFSKKIRNILFLAIIFSSIFILINLKIHPHFNNYKIIEKSPKHEGLIITRNLDCNNEVNCSQKIFKLQPRFYDVIKNFNNSAYGEIYLTSFNIWKDNIFFGIGLNNFTAVCNSSKYKKFHKDFGCTTHPHNLYIQALVESGIIGFILFSSLVVLFFLKINNLFLLENKIILFSTLLTIFWPIMSTGSLLKNWNMVFISFICSVILISIDCIKKRQLTN